MKYFEFTFDTNPCTETVNDVLAAVLGDAGFESFIEREGGLSAYIQQSLCNEEVIKNALNEFPLPDTEITYNYVEAEDKNWNEEWEYPDIGFPFGETQSAGHDMYYMDFRFADENGEPRIVRIDNEMDNEVYFVADNLVEFIKLIIANQEIEEKRLD